jgi:hypothetical protein
MHTPHWCLEAHSWHKRAGGTGGAGARRRNLVVVGVLQLGPAVVLGVGDVLAQRLLRQDVRVRVRRRLRLRVPARVKNPGRVQQGLPVSAVPAWAGCRPHSQDSARVRRCAELGRALGARAQAADQAIIDDTVVKVSVVMTY